MLVVFILLASLTFSNLGVHCLPCDNDNLDMLHHCNELMDGMNGELNGLTQVPVASKAGPIIEKCENSLKCLKSVDCFEVEDKLNQTISRISSVCESLYLMAGPVAKCVEKLKSELPTLKNYTCSRHLRSKSNIMGDCQLYQNSKNFDCAVKMMADRCGEEAKKELESRKDYILQEIKCY